MGSAPAERTLVLVKPDGVQRGLVGEIVARLERRGLKLVALKLILPEHSREERFRERFRRESRVAAAIDHPNVIPIFDAGDATRARAQATYMAALNRAAQMSVDASSQLASGTESSNPLRSAIESFSIWNSARDDRNTRLRGRLRIACGSGERSAPRIRPPA